MREGDKQALLKYLEQPRTYADVSTQFGWAYRTSWQNVNELVQAGVVEEMPRRAGKTGRQICFCRIHGTRDSSVVKAQWKQHGRLPIGELIYGVWAGVSSLKTDEQLLGAWSLPAYLYMRSTEQARGNVPAMGVMAPVEVQGRLRTLKQRCDETSEFIQTLLLRPELFDDSAAVKDMFGVVDRVVDDALMTIGQEARERSYQRPPIENQDGSVDSA
jgi:hypothetical protein